MRNTIIFLIFILASEISLAQTTGKYADVNGIHMYYEIHGSGKPLVLIHGGGSTVRTSFGRILPLLAKTHKVIAVELQAHGHTSDRNAPESFQQDADDVAELLRQLNIANADIFGFSNGGNTAMQIAIRHPEKVHKLILASTFYKRDGMVAGFWDGMDKATFSDMPQVYNAAYLKIHHDSAGLLNMFKKDSHRMQTFKDWSDDDIKSIHAPAFIVVGDQDVIRPEHAVVMHDLIAHSRLAVLPGAHGSYMGEEITNDPKSNIPEFFVTMVNKFLASK